MSFEIHEGQEGQEPRREERRHPVEESLRGGRTEAPERETQAGGDRLERSMRNMNRLFARPMGRTAAGEYLNKFVTGFTKIFNPEVEVSSESPVQLDSFRVIGLDSNEYGTACSAAIVILPLEQTDGIHVFAHTLLLEGSAPAPAPIQGEWNNRRYEVVQTIGDTWNEKFMQRVEDAAMSFFVGKGAKFYDAGTQVVPSEVNPEKDVELLKTLAFYTTAAITTLSVEVLKYQPAFGLDFLDKRDTLDVSVDFSPETLHTAAGQPKRTDVKLNLTATVNEDDVSRRQPLTVVGGILELVYAPPAPENDRGEFGRRRDEGQKYFYPLFNINTLDTEYKAISLELELLGLASTALLSDRYYWVNGFRPKPSVSGREKSHFDPKDIGALNYLVPGSMGKVDTKAASFSDDDFLDYFGALCHGELVYGIQVEERGEQSWLHQIFLTAAGKGQDAFDATNMIIDSSDTLTNKHFSRCFKELGGDRITLPAHNKIILGTYTDDLDQVHDLRDFDLLRFLNMRGAEDPELALAYQDTFDQIDTPVDYRIERRIAILQSILGGNLKIKGMAQQLFFHYKFIEALAMSVKDAGATINRISSGGQFTTTRQRGNSLIGQYAGRDLGSDLFNTWGRRDESGRDYGSSYMGRVRRY